VFHIATFAAGKKFFTLILTVAISCSAAEIFGDQRRHDL